MKKAAIDVHRLNAPSFLWGIGLFDHSNYWRFGYPAVMITDTAFFRNPSYHNMGDRIETLDFSRMREVVNGVGLAVMNLK